MIIPKYSWYILFAAAVIVLMFPYALRNMQDNTTLPGEEPYYHARVAGQILDGSISSKDGFVSGRPYFFNPYHFVLAAFSLPFGVITASKIVPLLQELPLFAYFIFCLESLSSRNLQFLVFFAFLFFLLLLLIIFRFRQFSVLQYF